MNYRSFDNLNQTLLARLGDLPSDLRLIVGVPRSGLLAANLLALHLNLPLTDLAGLIAGRLLQGGRRCQENELPTEPGSILILDDSICSGASMAKARQQLAGVSLPQRLVFAAVFATPKNTRLVDIYFDSVPIPRVFEWNLFHCCQIGGACMDILTLGGTRVLYASSRLLGGAPIDLGRIRTLRWRIPELRITPGPYAICLRLQDPQEHHYIDYVAQAAVIEVLPSALYHPDYLVGMDHGLTYMPFELEAA